MVGLLTLRLFYTHCSVSVNFPLFSPSIMWPLASLLSPPSLALTSSVWATLFRASSLPGLLTSGPLHFRAPSLPGPLTSGPLCLLEDLSAWEPSTWGQMISLPRSQAWLEKKTKKSHSLRNSCHYNNGPWSRMGIESHQYFHSVFLTILSTLEH